MNFWQKASLGSLGIVGLFGVVKAVQAADCPLLPQTPYKSPDSSAVYYINRSCTKRPFTNETAYFAYFSSWKQVKITTAKILHSIPDDPKGPMSYKLPGTPVATKPVKSPDNPPPVTESKPVVDVPAITLPKNEPAKPVETPVTPVLTTPTISNIMTDFLRCPTSEEQSTLDQNFNFMWGKDWEKYPFTCDYHTTNPSRLSIYATVRLLKDLQFSKPLPFTNGQSLYRYLTAQKLTINPSQNCSQYSTGWDFVLNLGGNFSRTHAVKSGSATCERSEPSVNEKIDTFVYNPLYKAGTFVHEAHHALSGSLHPNTNGSDKNITDNSAWAAQFYFYSWVHLYSNVDTNTKLLAKNAARDIWNSRFSENKCPTDSDLKTVVNQIAGSICP